MAPLFLLLVLLLGCLEEPALVQVPLSSVPSSQRVETETGTLTLHEATWTLSDLRLQAPAATASLPPWHPASWTAVAWAHPGHDFAGEVWGELLDTWTLDLLGEPRELGLVQVYEGELATASLTLERVDLQGEIDLEGQLRSFSLSLELQERVEGLPLDVDLAAQSPGALELGVDLAHALSFVDWQAPDEDEDGQLSLSDADTENTLRFGVLSTPSFTLTWER